MVCLTYSLRIFNAVYLQACASVSKVLRNTLTEKYSFNMWHNSVINFTKVLIQVILLIVFLKFFGLDAIRRYNDKKTMIVKSKRQSGGIAGPAITVVAKHNTSKTGWREQPEQAGGLTNMLYNQCRDFEEFNTIQNCTESKTFDWETIVRDLHVGTNNFKVSMMNATLWTEDVTVGNDGRYHTVTIPNKISTEWRQDQIFLYLNPELIYDIYVHETNYFILNKHSFGLPTCHKEIIVDRAGGQYYELILTEHTVLDFPEDPCEADRDYNFQVKTKACD